MLETRFRSMRAADLAAVFALQCEAYPQAYHEPPDSLASRLHSGPQMCFVAEVEGVLAGYLLAHPWGGAIPELHKCLPEIVDVDHVFLHDMVIHPQFRRMALGQGLYAVLRKVAVQCGYRSMQLMAVAEACRFWRSLGFVEITPGSLPKNYGTAVPMRCSLPV